MKFPTRFSSPQETKFKEALKYYEMIVQKHTDNILSVSAIVLANLCVSYIMTSQVRPSKIRPKAVYDPSDPFSTSFARAF